MVFVFEDVREIKARITEKLVLLLVVYRLTVELICK